MMAMFASLARGSKAVLQFYPENAQQMEMITTAAMRCGFTGGLLVDFPHSSKAKKYFLVLFAGAPSAFQMPKALGSEEDEQANQIAYASEDRAYPLPLTIRVVLILGLFYGLGCFIIYILLLLLWVFSFLLSLLLFYLGMV